MWYMPYLRVRRAAITYGCIVLAITLVGVAFRFVPGVVHVGGRHGVNANLDLSALIAGSAAFVAGLATVLGLNLAAENDGHLELAWTKPISREGYALGVFAVDIVAMIVCVAFTAICGAIIIDTLANAQVVTFGPAQDSFRTLLYCGFPLLVYAWVTALSASLKRNRGSVAAAFWPVMAVLAIAPHIPYPPLIAAAPLLHAINLFTIELFQSSSPEQGLNVLAWKYAWGWLVAAGLLVVAVVQWRRLEL
jgi:hypothetical protein